MTTERIADLLDARKAGPGKWLAKCPAHDDRSPSLSIREGHDGRVLLWCWAGCDTAAVLKASGLTMGSLFAGPPPSREQLQTVAHEREGRRAAAAKVRQANVHAGERVQKLAAVVKALGAKLASQPDDNALATLFHLACEKLHNAERLQEEVLSVLSVRTLPKIKTLSIEGAA